VAVEGLEERVLMAMSLKAGGSGYSNLLATDSAAVRQQKLIIDPPEALAGSVSTLYDAAKVTIVGASPGPGYENANFAALVEVQSPTGARRLQPFAEFLQRPLGTETGYVQVHFQLTGSPGKIRIPDNWIPLDVDGTDGTDPASIDFRVRDNVPSDNLFKYRSYAAKEGEHGNPEDFLLTDDGTQTRIGPGLLSAADSSNRPTDGSIVGTVFEDFDGNGVKNGDDRGLPDVIVYLDLNLDGKLEDNEPRQPTNEIGGYVFDDLKPGDYLVREETPPRYLQTTDRDGKGVPVTVREGRRERVNFGNARPATISGTVFNDANNNGTLDAGEAGLAGAVVYADLNNNGTRDTAEPAATSAATTGAWSIASLLPGPYVLRQVPPSGYAQTLPAANGPRTLTLASGSFASGVEFGDSFRPVPTVQEVFVRSDRWSAAFQKELAGLQLGDPVAGFRIPFPTRLPVLLPWVNLDEVVVRFSQPVNVDPGDLVIRGTKSAQATVSVVPLTSSPNTYRFSFGSPFAGDGSVRTNGDRFGLNLDGDPPNGVRAAIAGAVFYMDGNNDGQPGGDLLLPFNVLEGDVNHSGGVNVTDYAQTLRRVGSSVDAMARYSVFNDLDGNGAIDFADLRLLRSRIGRTLPAVQAPPAATALAVTGRPQPTRRGLFNDEPLLG
jgi:hypothetical protein